MTGTELHVQASIWKRCRIRERSVHGQVSRAVVVSRGAPGRHAWAHDVDLAVLVMEGEATGGTDALYWAALTRGLVLTTDLDHLDLRLRSGWHALFDAGTVTIGWPHPRPLLHGASVDLPAGWIDAATALRLVVLVVGHGLGLGEARTPPGESLAGRLTRAASAGALAAGAVTVEDQPS